MPTYEQCLDLLNNSPVFISSKITDRVYLKVMQIYGVAAPTNFYAIPVGDNRIMIYWDDSVSMNGVGINTPRRDKYRIDFYNANTTTKVASVTISGDHEFTCDRGNCNCAISPIREYAVGKFYAVVGNPITGIPGIKEGQNYNIVLTPIVKTTSDTYFYNGRPYWDTYETDCEPAEAISMLWKKPSPVTNLKATDSTNSVTVSWDAVPYPYTAYNGLRAPIYRVGISANNGPYSVYYTGPNTSVSIPKVNDVKYRVRVTALYLPWYNEGNLTQLFTNFKNYSCNYIIPSKNYIGSSKTYIDLPTYTRNPLPPTINNATLLRATPIKTYALLNWTQPAVTGNWSISGYTIEYGISSNPSSWTEAPVLCTGSSFRISIPVRSTQGISFRMKTKNTNNDFSSYSNIIHLPTP